VGIVQVSVELWSNEVCDNVPGNRMGRVDGLSRRPDWEVGVERDNEEQTLVKKEWLEARVAQVSEVVIKGVNILDKIRKSEVKNNKVVKAVEEMK